MPNISNAVILKTYTSLIIGMLDVRIIHNSGRKNLTTQHPYSQLTKTGIVDVIIINAHNVPVITKHNS